MKKRIFAGIIAASLVLSAFPAVYAQNDTELLQEDDIELLAEETEEVFEEADELPADEIAELFDEEHGAEAINDIYDEVMAENSCDTAVDGATLESGAPDGSGYIKTGSTAAVLASISADTSDEYMWEADVRFDEDKSGFSISSSKGTNGVRILRDDSRSGSICRWRNSRETRTTAVKLDDTGAWYHIQVIGHHTAGSVYTSQLIRVTKFDAQSGQWVFIGEDSEVGPVSSTAVSRFSADANTSVDNVRVTRLGADTLTLSTLPANTTQLNAGSVVQMQFAATRNERDIVKPAIEWKAFDGDSEITDGSVTVNANGEVAVSADCPSRTVTIKAISTEKGNVEGDYNIAVKAVDLGSEPFDTISVASDKDYVTANEPLALKVTASKGGESVDPSSAKIVWKFYNEANLQATENKYISVNENNELCVTDKVISQVINVRAESESGAIYSEPLKVSVKATDAVEKGENGKGDRILLTDAGENTAREAITSGSWDGSHYYYTGSSSLNMDSVAATTEDMIIEADLQFKELGSGIVLKNGGSLGAQLSRREKNGDNICKIGASESATAIVACDPEAWYHVTVTSRCGTDDSYANVSIYKYDADGNRVNPLDPSSSAPITDTLVMRNMSSKSFQYVEVYAGTGIDNLRIMKLIPDSLEMTLSASEIFAGSKAQASCSVLRKGSAIQSYPASKLQWMIRDAEGKAVDDSLIAIDADGVITADALAPEQTVYVWVISAEDSELSVSKPLKIKGNDLFEVTGIGLNKEGTAVTEIRIDKKFFYSGDVVFIVSVYDEAGKLIDVSVRSFRDNTLSVGENLLSIDEIELPDDFGSVKAMIWTSLS